MATQIDISLKIFKITDPLQEVPTAAETMRLLELIEEAGFRIEKLKVDHTHTVTFNIQPPSEVPPLNFKTWPTSEELNKLEHVHVNGECVKTRTGWRCDLQNPTRRESNRRDNG